MAWELLAIWGIVICVIAWFIRDESQARKSRLEALAQAYSISPDWRHRETAPVAHKPVAQRGLSPMQREFLMRLHRDQGRQG